MNRWTRYAATAATAVLILGLAATAGLTVRQSVLALRRDVETKATAFVNTNVKEVNSWLLRKKSLVEATANYIETQPDYRQNLPALLSFFAIADQDNAEAALWVGRTQVAATHPWTPPAGFDPTSRPWYRAALATDGAAFTSVFEDARTGRPAIAISKRIHLPGDNRPAVVMSVARLDYLDHLLAAMKLGQGGYAFVTDERTTLLVHPDHSLLTARLDVHPDPGLAKLGRALRNRRTGLTYYSARGVRKLAAYTRIPATGWVFGMVLPQAEAFGPLTAMRNTVLLVLGVLFLFVVFVWGLVRGLGVLTSRVERAATTAIVGVEGDQGEVDAEDTSHLELPIRWLKLVQTVDRAVANLESYPYVLSRILGLKDAYTAQHSQTVTRLAIDIGRELGVGPKETRELACAALLHDIGKVSIPDAILSKPGRLDEAEVEVIRTHPVTGAQVTREAHFAPAICDAILHHHEHFDGQGYPDGLAGEDIPLYARIIAVADTYDAMHSDRPYRTARPTSEVVEEMAEACGSQFDPRVFHAFVAVVRRDAWSVREQADEPVPDEEPA